MFINDRLIINRSRNIIVDDEDIWLLQEYVWSISNYGYAINTHHGGLLHRAVLKLNKENKTPIDHKNGNKLDNRKCNLRLCTQQQNSWNRKKNNNGYRYKGVMCYEGKAGKRYYAHIKVGDRYITSERFSTDIEAALKYDDMAMKYYGEFARTNKVLGLL